MPYFGEGRKKKAAPPYGIKSLWRTRFKGGSCKCESEHILGVAEQSTDSVSVNYLFYLLPFIDITQMKNRKVAPRDQADGRDRLICCRHESLSRSYLHVTENYNRSCIFNADFIIKV